MAELTPSERLQPCLLDRLTDDEPQRRQESRDQRIMSLPRYKQAVLRDLSWLLNCSCHTRDEPVYEFPEAAASVLNCGVRDVTGLTSGDVEAGELEWQITEALRTFEPRIDPRTLAVKVEADEAAGDTRAIRFEIKGELWAQPVPESLLIKTEVDLETGECRLRQGSHG